MALMSVPLDPGGDDRVCGLQQGLRLSDAEEIAAARLDGAAEGSLKEALAVASADEAGDAGPQVVTGIGAVGESFASGPLVRLIDARSADMDRAHASKPLDAFSPMPVPPLLDVGVTFAMPARSAPSRPLPAPEIAEADGLALMPSEDGPSEDGPSEDGPSEDGPSEIGSSEDRPTGDRPSEDRPIEEWQGFAVDTPGAPAVAPPQATAPAQSMQPLASALDAAVRLAADASVAADALENLKQLLEHKQRLESQLPQSAAGRAPAASNDAEAAASVPDRPVPPPLPPLPLHAESDIAGRPAHAMLPPQRRRQLPPERRGIDVRGFMAGFALSWAFGVVLYFFMTAG